MNKIVILYIYLLFSTMVAYSQQAIIKGSVLIYFAPLDFDLLNLLVNLFQYGPCDGYGTASQRHKQLQAVIAAAIL